MGDESDDSGYYSVMLPTWFDHSDKCPLSVYIVLVRYFPHRVWARLHVRTQRGTRSLQFF